MNQRVQKSTIIYMFLIRIFIFIVLVLKLCYRNITLKYEYISRTKCYSPSQKVLILINKLFLAKGRWQKSGIISPLLNLTPLRFILNIYNINFKGIRFRIWKIIPDSGHLPITKDNLFVKIKLFASGCRAWCGWYLHP